MDNKMPYREMPKKLGINESTLKKHLNKLKAAACIQRVGGTREHWEIRC